ncbi:MAG: hypothetical protein HQL35_12190 [Alphaproteobacteria bacterium]|nr:hypothetical protein [Alphaproteobacteria bacterium]
MADKREHSPLVPIVKWVGTLFGVTGAVLMAMNIPISGWGFVLFLVSSTAWTSAGVMTRDYSIIVLYAVFTAIDLLGIYRWLIA